VGYQRADLPRMAGGQLETDDGAAAAGKDVGAFLGGRREQAVSVVGEDLHDAVVLERAVERAVREAARIIGHDGVVRFQRFGDASECPRVGRPAWHHQQHRTRSANLVVKARARHA